MRPASLLKSTPFRLATIFALLFASAYLLAGVAVFEVVTRTLNLRLDHLVEQTSSVIGSAFGSGDMVDLTEMVSSYAVASPKFDRVVLLTDLQGKKLAGNLDPASLASGWSVVDGAAIGADPTQSYRILVRTVGPTTLAVGMSYADSKTLENVATTAFSWVSLVAFVLAIGGGAWVGSRAQRRLDAVTGTMDMVSRGKLAARISVSERGDDIDQLSLQINAALDRLSALVEGMRQVSSDIAHELRSPLNRLALTVAAARSRAAGGVDVGEDLYAAEAECFQLSATFDALLRITQIESGARRSRFTSVDLRTIVEAIGDAYVDVADERGQYLECHTAAGHFAISGDRDLLIQLVANLVENALRHTPLGTSVVVDLGRAGPHMTMTVTDNGPGIPEDERQNVFRRLYRLEKSRTADGSGLGLSLARAIVELHGGTIELADNHPGVRAIVRL